MTPLAIPVIWLVLGMSILTLLALAVGGLGVWKKKSLMTFIGFAAVFLTYAVGWQIWVRTVSVKNVTEVVENYEYLKTDDFRVILYLTETRDLYIKDDPNFFAAFDDADALPSLVRVRHYNLYGGMVSEVIRAQPPVSPDVWVPLADTVRLSPKSVVVVPHLRPRALPKFLPRQRLHRLSHAPEPTVARVLPTERGFPALFNDNPFSMRYIACFYDRALLRRNMLMLVFRDETNNLYVLRYEVAKHRLYYYDFGRVMASHQGDELRDKPTSGSVKLANGAAASHLLDYLAEQPDVIAKTSGDALRTPLAQAMSADELTK